MSDSENTQDKRKGEHLTPYQFKAGNSGRPKGARNKFGEAFINDFLDDWALHGAKAIADMREAEVGGYIRAAVAILPKEVNVKVSELDELSDEQIERQLAGIAAQLAAAGIGTETRIAEACEPEQAGEIPTLQ